MDSYATPITPAREPEAQKKRRRATACRNCNQQRVRCDASIIGLPCSNCKAAHAEECAFIHSKRTRGPAGRFIPSEDSSAGRVNSPTSTTPLRQYNDRQIPVAPVQNIRSTKTAKSPQFSLDLTRLCDSEVENTDAPIVTEAAEGNSQDPTTESNGGSDDVREDARYSSKASFIGESWYASFLLRATERTEHNQMHQPLAQSPQPTYPSPSLSNTHQRRTNGDNISRNFKAPRFPKDLPSPELRHRLLNTFFSRFHVISPILDRPSFLASVSNGTVSITLLRCVLFAASVHCDPEVYHLMGHSTRIDAGDDLFSKAKTSFDADTEADRVTMVQCSYLLHYWWGRPTTFRDSLWWLATATRSAQCMGMHRSTKHSKMTQRNKANWKRVWWCLYIRDRQVSLSVAAPMMINDIDTDVEELTLEDFPDEKPETAHYLIAQASLSRTASSIFFSCFCTSRLDLREDPAYRLNARQEIQNTLELWHDNLPEIMRYEQEGKHHLALCLQMNYNYYTISFHQRLQRTNRNRSIPSEGSDVVLHAANNITRLVEDAMIYWSPEYFPMICVTAIFSAMITQFVESHSEDTTKRDLLLQKLKRNLLGLKQFEQCYILARWIRNLFTDIIWRPKGASKRNSSVVEGQIMAASSSDATSSPKPTNMQNNNRTNSWQSSESDHLPAYTNRYCNVDLNGTSNVFYNSAPSTSDCFSLGEYGGLTQTYTTELSLQDNFDFPNLESLEFQGLQFLADLGLGGFRVGGDCERVYQQ